MTTLSAGDLEGLAVSACRAAADRIRVSETAVPLRAKSTETDVVTATDLAAENLIRDLLAESTPGARVLGEEGGNGTLGDGPHGAIEWVIDPLDGTVNFTYGVPITAVSVAAVVDGRPTAGAVVDVWRSELFSAHVGGGARLDGGAIRCAVAGRLGLALVATGYSYAAPLRQAHGRTIAELLLHVRDVRAFGSAALQLCWVAAGRIDAYLERDIKPWDYAAGSIIAREAGADVELPCPENDDLVLAVHPSLFDELRAHVV